MVIGTRFSLKEESFNFYRTLWYLLGYDNENEVNEFYVTDYYPNTGMFNYVDKIGYELGSMYGHCSMGNMDIVEQFYAPNYVTTDIEVEHNDY